MSSEGARPLGRALLRPLGSPDMFNTCTSRPTSSLEVLQPHVGGARGPDAVEAVAGLAVADVDVLAEALLSSLPRPAGDVPAYEVRPLVNARAS